MTMLYHDRITFRIAVTEEGSANASCETTLIITGCSPAGNPVGIFRLARKAEIQPEPS
jgi:hypothetical protein